MEYCSNLGCANFVISGSLCAQHTFKLGFNELPTSLHLLCFSFLSARDVSRAMQCNCRLLLLFEELRRCNPQIVGMSASALRSESTSAVIRGALDKLTSRPNIAFVYYSGEWPQQWTQAAEDLLPPDTKIVAACAQTTQSCIDGSHTAAEKDFSIMLGSFPEAVFAPFAIDSNGEEEEGEDLYAIIEKALVAQGTHDPSFWKAFVLHCSDPGLADAMATAIQERHPEAAVIGGICEGVALRACEQKETKMPDFEHMNASALKFTIVEAFGPEFLASAQEDPDFDPVACAKKAYDSQNNSRKVRVIESGIVGVALGGNVPLRSIVSRGVKPLWNRSATVKTAVPLGEEVSLITHVQEDANISPTIQWLRECCSVAQQSPQFVGLKRSGERGFTLSGMHRDMMSTQGMMLEGKDMQGAQLQLYSLNSESSVQDIDNMMGRLQEEVQNNNEELIGALMFSCAGRGPEASRMIREPMMDARHFQAAFPIPLVGFYAGGEIGPMAMAEVEEGAAQFGKATLQGFTVVFGVFVKPVMQQVGAFFENLDDLAARAAYSRSQASAKRKTPPENL